MDVEAGWDVAVQVIKKGEKFLVAMARLTLSDHFAIVDVERGEQGGSAVAIVILTPST
jgi:hypothetical protein